MLYPADAAWNAPTVASPEGEGTPASWLAASIAQMRIFACALPVSASARVAKKWINSAGLGESAVNPGGLLPVPKGRDVAVPCRARAPGHQDGQQRRWRGGACGARGTSAQSVSSTAWFVCFSCRGCPPRRRITAASRSFASRRAESKDPSHSTAPAVQADRDHRTIAERPAGLRRPAAQAVAYVPEPAKANGDDIRAAAATEPQLGPPLLLRRLRGDDGAARTRGAHMAHRLGQPVRREETQLFSPLQDTVKASVHTAAG